MGNNTIHLTRETRALPSNFSYFKKVKPPYDIKICEIESYYILITHSLN